MRLRPLYTDYVWSYDFMADRTRDARAIRLLTIIDEYSRECLAIDVARQLNSEDVLDRLKELFITRGLPTHIRADACVRLGQRPRVRGGEGAGTAAAPGRRAAVHRARQPCGPAVHRENGYNESINGKLRDECLDGELFDTLQESQVLVERWRGHYNHVRPHSSLGYRPPAPAAWTAGAERPGVSLSGATG